MNKYRCIQINKNQYKYTYKSMNIYKTIKMNTNSKNNKNKIK